MNIDDEFDRIVSGWDSDESAEDVAETSAASAPDAAGDEVAGPDLAKNEAAEEDAAREESAEEDASRGKAVEGEAAGNDAAGTEAAGNDAAGTEAAGEAPAGGGELSEREALADPVQTTQIGLILLPLGPVDAVSEVLSFYGIARWVVPVGRQSALWLELEPAEGEDFDSLLGDERPMPEECDKFARILSHLSRLGAVAICSSLVPDEEGLNGNVLGRRYLGGEPDETIPAGLLLNSLDQRAEDLLLGRTHPSDYDDAIHPEDRPEPRRGFGRPFRFGR